MTKSSILWHPFQLTMSCYHQPSLTHIDLEQISSLTLLGIKPIRGDQYAPERSKSDHVQVLLGMHPGLDIDFLLSKLSTRE